MKNILKKSVALLTAGVLFTGIAAFAEGEESSETTYLYTSQAWRTFEVEEKDDYTTNPRSTPFYYLTKSTDSTFTHNIPGKYGKGIEIAKADVTLKQKPTLGIALKNAVTLAEAVENNITVEIAFDYYAEFPDKYGNYFYLSSADRSQNFATVRIKNDGEITVRDNSNPNADPLTILKNGNEAELAEFHNFRMTISAKEVNGENKWVLDSFYYDGTDTGKYASGTVIGSGDFSHMYFQFASDVNQNGKLGLDNISVASYTTPEAGEVSPVPDRYTYMDNVLQYKTLVEAYDHENITAAYDEAVNLFEKSYVVKDFLDTALGKLEAVFPKTVVNYGFDTLAEAKSSVRNSSRFKYDETTLTNEYGYGNALYWDYDYNNAVGQRGYAMEFITGISTFDSIPANTYVETAFDVKYNLNDGDKIKFTMLNPERAAFATFYVSDSKIYAKNDESYAVESSENEMQRVKFTVQITDENGEIVNKITSLKVNENKLSDIINVDKPYNATGYSYMGVELDALDNTVCNEVWIDNFSVVTYVSENGTAITADKYMLAKKLEQLSALKQNEAVAAEIKTTIDTEVPEILKVFKDPALPQSSADEAVASADAVIAEAIGESNNMFEITGINYVVGDSDESSAMTDGAKVSSVEITDRNINAGDAYLMVVSYSDNGKVLYSMNSVKLKNTVFSESNKINIELSLPDSAADTKVKAFVFSSLKNITPVSEAYTD